MNKKDNVKTTLNRLDPSEVRLEIKDPVDPLALEQARSIMNELGTNDSQPVDPEKLLTVARRLGDVMMDATEVTVSKEECKAAYESLSERERNTLNNIYERVSAFAQAQRQSITDMQMDIPGGKAGHTVSPCKGTDRTMNHEHEHVVRASVLANRNNQVHSLTHDHCSLFSNFVFSL